MMKQTFLVLTLCILCFSCKESSINKPINHQKSNLSLSETSAEKGLFLGLSVDLSQEEFDYKLDSLQTNGNLINKQFIIKLDGTDVSFVVKKTKNSINLLSSHIEEKTLFSEDPRDITRVQYENFREIVEQFRDYFDIKYKHYYKGNYDMNKTLFNQKYNDVYITPTKSIVIGYTLVPFHNEIPTNKPLKKNFGYILEINYFTNDVFNPIFNEINNTKEAKENELEKKVKEQQRIESKKKENLNSL